MKLSSWKNLLADIIFVAARDKKWWIVPLIAVLLIVAGILVVMSVSGALVPFIYPLI